MKTFKVLFFIKIYAALFPILCSTLVAEVQNSFILHDAENEIESNRILYLMQSGNLSKALEIYKQLQKEKGHHDFDLIQQMGLILLDQGIRSRDAEIQLLTIFGAGISLNEKALYILQEGLNSSEAQIQLISLNFLSRFQNDIADESLIRAMSSDSLLIRLEAAFHLAEKKAPQAVAQTEALMYKVDPQLTFLFPQLFALIGNSDAMKIMRRLLTHQDEEVRIETILSAAKHGRDDLLPQIRILATHHQAGQQEACASALGMMKDEKSVGKLETLSKSNIAAVRLAALQALYRLGRKEIRSEIEKEALKQDPFAIGVLSEMQGSEDVLFRLTKSSNIQTRVNAALALLERQDPRCILPICEILIKDSRDLGYIKVTTKGKALAAWKVTPSALQNFKEDPVAHELSLNLREAVLSKSADLSENVFLTIANLIFEREQNDLIPVLVELLENLQTPAAIELIKKYQQKAGAPLIRNYCNLTLYLLKEQGPYAQNLMDWIVNKQGEDFIRFRPFIPWEKRDSDSSYQLTPQETSSLLIHSFESLVQMRDEKGIDLLLNAIKNGNSKNKYALAGLLMRAVQ